eukprot:1438282-Amphidinium_carterae.1
MVLVGNSFAEPRSYPAFPAWIHATERGQFFVVGNRHLSELLLGAACSGLGFGIALFFRTRLSRRKRWLEE